MTDIKNENYFKNIALDSQAGDDAAYRELLLAISSSLRPFVLSHTFNLDNTEDILQDILLVIHKSLHTYNAKYSFYSWLFTITQNRAKEYISKYQKILERDIAKKDFLNYMSKDMSSKIDNENFEAKVQQALDTLPEKQRQVILMLKVNDYYLKKVALELKLTEHNIKNIAYDAYKAIRAKLSLIEG